MHRRMILRSMPLLLLVAFTALAGPPDTRPTTRPEVNAAVQRLISEPRSEKYRKAIADPGIETDAWPILERAVREPVPPQTGPIHLRSDNTDLLEAMAAIDGPRCTALALDLARGATDVQMRRTAVGLLNYPLKLETPAARQAVEEALKDPDGGVIMAGLDYVQRHPDPDAGPAVLEILRHPQGHTLPAWVDENQRDGPRNRLFDEALDAIANTHDPDAVDDLLRLMDDRSVETEKVAAAIGDCGGGDQNIERRNRAIARLAVALKSPAMNMRTAAAFSLALLGDARGGPVLARALRICQAYKPRDDKFINVYSAVRGLEAITKADYGASLGEDYWEHWLDWADKGEPTGPKAMLARVDAVMADLHKRGIEPEEDPPLRTSFTDAERHLLEVQLKDLADPRGRSFVSYAHPQRTCWGSVTTQPAEGWLRPASATQPANLVDDHGDVVPVYDDVKPIDLAGDTARQVAEVEGSAKVRDHLASETYPLEVREVLSDSRAAWLYRLGNEKLAAQSLSILHGPWSGEIVSTHTAAPAPFRTFSEAINSYIVRDDDAAYKLLDRYRKRYPGVLEKDPPAMKLLSELDRRRAEGSYVANAPPATMPAEHNEWGHWTDSPKFQTPDDFDKWPVDKRVAWLIHELQEMDQRQQGQPGGVDVSADPRVEALVAIGDPAVPALIECIDHDERLTRSVQFWRDFSEDRNIIGVRECALSAVESILGTSVFEPASTGDSFSGRGEEQAHKTARQLRAYWEKYGKVPYTKRMMGILTDPKCTTSAAYSAAYALAHANEERRIGTQIWTGGAKPKPGSNPVIGEFDKPTVAEAILALYDRTMEQMDHPAKGAEPAGDYERKRAKDGFADLLMTLQDRRITPALMERCTDAKSHEDLRRWATVCYVLAEERPMFTLAAKFGSGELELGPVDPQSDRPMQEPGNVELTEWVKCLGSLDNAFADNALNLLAEPKHPYHARAAAIVRSLMIDHGADSDTVRIWSTQPVYIRLARPLLDDVTATETTESIEGDRLRETTANGWGSSEVPAELSDPQVRRASARLRICDIAAAAICHDLAGCPDANALFKDSEDRLARLKKFLDTQGPTLRRLPGNWQYQADFGSFFDGPAICPAVPLTGSPDRPLPLIATWIPPGEKPQKVLIVSIIKDADGRDTNLILARHEFKSVPASELSEIKALE